VGGGVASRGPGGRALRRLPSAAGLLVAIGPIKGAGGEGGRAGSRGARQAGGRAGGRQPGLPCAAAAAPPGRGARREADCPAGLRPRPLAYPQGDADAALARARAVEELAAAAEAQAATAAAGGGGQQGPKKGGVKGMAVRMRNYQPALLAFALTGRGGEARALHAELAAMGKEHLDFSGAHPGQLPAI
jgi:hypothetical protein